jgi:predicted O-methyltransferase YrrM
MGNFKQALSYFNHQLTARNSKGFGIHSPYIFHLVTRIVHDFTPFYCYSDIEKERERLLQNHQTIKVTDFGSGSKALPHTEKKISDIAKHSLKPKTQAQLLFRLLNHFESKSILELGTSLGITTSYLASVSSKSKLITLEGCPEICKQAQQTFSNLNLKNIELITGNINNTLNEALKKLSTLDFVFFDGNHQKDATLNYFQTCLPFKHNNTVFVFDDIHKSDEMTKAWEQIKMHNEVKVTLDLFYLGIVFFKHEFTKQHFNIKF